MDVVSSGGHHALFGYPGNTLLERHSRPVMSLGPDEAVYCQLPRHCRSYLLHRTRTRRWAYPSFAWRRALPPCGVSWPGWTHPRLAAPLLQHLIRSHASQLALCSVCGCWTLGPCRASPQSYWSPRGSGSKWTLAPAPDRAASWSIPAGWWRSDPAWERSGAWRLHRRTPGLPQLLDFGHIKPAVILALARHQGQQYTLWVGNIGCIKCPFFQKMLNVATVTRIYLLHPKQVNSQ